MSEHDEHFPARSADLVEKLSVWFEPKTASDLIGSDMTEDQVLRELYREQGRQEVIKNLQARAQQAKEGG